jgi:integrase
MSGGLRVSEVLRINYSDILVSGQIIINASKGSNNRVVTSLYHTNYLLSLKHNTGQIYEGYTRFYYYRLFKSIGLYIVNQSSGNNSVTHSLRHTHVKMLHSSTNDKELIQRTIGHKSKKSTEYYINKNSIPNK